MIYAPLGRLPGWIAHWLEQRRMTSARISRPRQSDVGEKARPWVPIDQR
jgi:citrate synthase